uniref:Methyltransferase type 11 domain-containing protein n=1 Tax=Ciona intestinalis TaxID=7719 RepID=H2XNZ2_CIOIN
KMLRYYETRTLSKAGLKYHPKYPSKIIETAMKYSGYKDGKNLDFLLDVSCGAGQATKLFSPYFKTVLGVDPSLPQLETAKENCYFDNVTFKEGVAEDLPVAKESVDMVVAGAATHWFNVEAFFKETERVLKPGGTLVVLDYDSPKFLPVGLHSKANAEKLELDEAEKFVRLDLIPNYNRSRFCIIDRTRYRDIFEAMPFNDKHRIDSFTSKHLWTLEDAMGFLKSMDVYEHLKKSSDNEVSRPTTDVKKKEADFVEDFECLNSDVFMVATFQYFVLIANKP